MAETVDYAPFETTTAGPVEPAAPAPVTAEELSRLHDVSVELAVEVGRTQMTIREALALGPGSIVTLNRLAGEPVDLLVNGKPIARGEVVVIDEEFGLRVTEVLAPKNADGRRRRLASAQSGITGGVHSAARAVASFWRKAYEDGLTGLAAMVAYNLLLSIFPLALISLFVAGRVLRSPELAASVIADARTIFPTAAESTLIDGIRRLQEASTTVGIVALVSSLWVGASFWGALDTAFCRIYHLPCRTWVRQKLFGFGMLAVVLVFIAASVAVPTVQALLASGAEDLPFGLAGTRDLIYWGTIAIGLVVLFGALCITYVGRAQGRRSRGRASGRARSGRRSPSASSTRSSPSTCRTSRRCGSAPARCSS